MENNSGTKSVKVLNIQKSFDGKRASIIIDVFDARQKKNVISIFSGCEILPGGKYRKDVSSRHIGLQYFYF